MSTTTAFVANTLTLHPNESILYGFDFAGTGLLGTTETLMGTPAVTASPDDLTIADAAVNAAAFGDGLGGTVAIGQGVQVRLSAGTDGTRYTITCTVATNAGNTLVLVGHVDCTAADKLHDRTLDGILSAYVEYADWESYRDTDQTTAITRARLFVTAAARLLALLPKVSETRQRTRAEFDTSEIRRQLEHARRYLTITGGAFASDPVKHVNFQNFRD